MGCSVCTSTTSKQQVVAKIVEVGSQHKGAFDINPKRLYEREVGKIYRTVGETQRSETRGESRTPRPYVTDKDIARVVKECLKAAVLTVGTKRDFRAALEIARRAQADPSRYPTIDSIVAPAFRIPRRFKNLRGIVVPLGETSSPRQRYDQNAWSEMRSGMPRRGRLPVQPVQPRREAALTEPRAELPKVARSPEVSDALRSVVKRGAEIRTRARDTRRIREGAAWIDLSEFTMPERDRSELRRQAVGAPIPGREQGQGMKDRARTKTGSQSQSNESKTAADRRARDEAIERRIREALRVKAAPQAQAEKTIPAETKARRNEPRAKAQEQPAAELRSREEKRDEETARRIREALQSELRKKAVEAALSALSPGAKRSEAEQNRSERASKSSADQASVSRDDPRVEGLNAQHSSDPFAELSFPKIWNEKARREQEGASRDSRNEEELIAELRAWAGRQASQDAVMLQLKGSLPREEYREAAAA